MKLFNLSFSKKAIICASFLLSSGWAGIEAFADYCFFIKPESWPKTPHIWAWNDATGSNINCCNNSEWPGDEMVLVDASKNLYRWDSPDAKHPNYIIISADVGTTKYRMYGSNSLKSDGDTPFVNGATYSSDSSYTMGDTPPVPVADSAGAVKGWADDGTTVTVNCENAHIYVTPVSDRIVKIFTLPKDTEGEERRSISVVATPDAEYNVSGDNAAYLSIAISGGDEVRIDKSSGLVSFYDSEGNMKLSEAKYLKNASNNHTVSFKPMNDAAFFGGGYNGSNGNIKDMTVILNNSQNWGWSGGEFPRCITIPFAASTSGYGVLFDDHWRGATMSPSSQGLSYSSNAQNPISYYYVGGDNLDEVVANYTHLTGRQELPPYWALGYITSRYSYWNESEAQGVISDIKNANIPLDGIVFDLGWEGASEAGMGNLTWYTPSFNNPQKMMKDWLDRGIHTIVITEPYFSQETSNYTHPLSQGYFADESTDNMRWVSSRNVGLLDVTNPAALDWMWTFYHDRTREGMSGWWLDLGEPEQHDSDAHHLGGSVSQVHNEFGQLWIERVYRGYKEDFPDKRPFIMPRSGTSGMQRFSTFPWTGDIARSWGGLASQIPSLINMSMAGVSYIGSDVGGFACFQDGYTDANLYLRWVEFAALSPMMRTHSKYYPEPTNSAYSSVLADVRNFINLRYRLLPYTYTLSYYNATKGLPMARPACAFDSNTGKLANVRDAYLWGKDIYVAPVIDNRTSRSITFPDGEWVDFNNLSNIYRGGESVNYSAPLNVLPYFMRRGSFIPMFTKSESFGSTSEISYDDITVLHSVDTSKEGEYEGVLFEDDRTSTNTLENNEYTLIHFYGKADGNGNYSISVEPETGDATGFMPDTRTIRLSLFGYTGTSEPVLTVKNQPAIALFATRADENTFTRKNNKAEVDAHPGHAYCQTDAGEMYMKTVLPSTSAMRIALGDIDTGVTEIENAATSVSIEYVTGTINYSVPDIYDNAHIEFISPDGRIIARESNIKTDGYVHSIVAPDFNGFCIARLKASSSKGSAEKSVKYMR